ncbi:hypothetical protein ACWD1Z_33675 [Streptomyces sp. NPDC002784]
MSEFFNRGVSHIWWAIAALFLALALEVAAIFWRYPLIVQAVIGIAVLCPLILLSKTLKSRRNGSATKTAKQTRFYAIALAFCWALIIVPIAFVVVKGRSHPDWSDVILLAAIGASALALAIIQESIAARRGR